MVSREICRVIDQVEKRSPVAAVSGKAQLYVAPRRGGSACRKVNRREFVKTGSGGRARRRPRPSTAFGSRARRDRRRTARARSSSSSANGHQFKNGGDKTCVETAFERMIEGRGRARRAHRRRQHRRARSGGHQRRLRRPAERRRRRPARFVGACTGRRKRAGAVARIEGVRTPSLVAKRVMEETDHHLIVGQDAQRFARTMGFKIEDDLNTETLAHARGSSGSGAPIRCTTSTPIKKQAALRQVELEMMAEGWVDPEPLLRHDQLQRRQRARRRLRRDDDERAGLEDSRPRRRLADSRRRAVRGRRSRRRRIDRPRRSEPVQPRARS